MARPLEINPLNYIVKRQYSDSLLIKNKLFKERLKQAKNLFRKDLLAHYGCVNAIEFSEGGDLLVSGGDDRRVLLWFVQDAIYERGTPVVMQTNHTSNIFCLAFDKLNSKIFSGGNDDQVILHDLKTGQLILKLPHRNPVYGLSINPQSDHVLATAGDDGRILIYDIRDPVPEAICLAKQNTGFHSVVFHPTNPRLLVSANADEGIALWDCRKVKKELIHYDPMAGKVSGISACFNTSGSHVLALRRRLPPVLYATQNPNALCQFYHPQYYNSCTMKTCCFAGDEDEYVLSGSDDFNLYMWSIPEDGSEWGKSHIVLNGHRSIVNQVRYNKNNNLIASSGVEKMVKLWSTLPIGTWTGSLLTDCCEPQRTVYSKNDYNSIIGPSTSRISHDYSDQSTQEDLRMMAFFDSLIQTEIQNWNSMSEDTFTSDSDSDKQVQESIRLSWQSLLKCRKSAEESLKKHKPNKIALLIAQKRDKLAKMAHWKSSALVQRCNSHEKHRKRKSIRKLKSFTAYHKFRKNNGLCTKNVHTKRVTRSCSSSAALRSDEKETAPTPTSASVASKKQQHPQQHHHHHHHHKSRAEASVQKKYRTRSQSMREMCEVANSGANSSCFDVPSTSTGITGTASSVYRVIEQDSDEEISPGNACNENGSNLENNFVDIIPTPLNGSHDMYINMLDMPNNNNVNNNSTNNNNNGSNSNIVNGSNNNNNNVLTLRNDDLALRNDYDTDAESFNNEFNYVNENGYSHKESNELSSCSDSDPNYGYTPIKRRRRNHSEIDSGFATGSCSSNNNSYAKRSLRNNSASCSVGRSATIGGSYGNDHSSDDDCHYEKFKKRVKKACVNIRKQIGGDSDSN